VSYTADELYGICGMTPAFATENAHEMTATNTVDVDNLKAGLDRAIKDGIHMFATTGTFGQVWNLLEDEWETYIRAAIEVVDNRIPLMLGVTAANPRLVVQKMNIVRDAGGQGVLLGIPYYYKLPNKDVVSFYQEISKLFPEISIMIYHNPTNHRVHIPVAMFKELVKLPNIVAMKDSHREVVEFQRLHEIIHGKIAHFVNQMQLYPYLGMGGSGCWSHAIWGGPWPILAAYQAAADGDNAKVQDIMRDIQGAKAPSAPGDPLRAGHESYEYNDYIKMGSPRPPFSFNMD
jgi:dihydrodipicolinate synthase/N-acetylneuraminate lyase